MTWRDRERLKRDQGVSQSLGDDRAFPTLGGMAGGPKKADTSSNNMWGQLGDDSESEDEDELKAKAELQAAADAEEAAVQAAAEAEETRKKEAWAAKKRAEIFGQAAPAAEAPAAAAPAPAEAAPAPAPSEEAKKEEVAEDPDRFAGLKKKKKKKKKDISSFGA